MDKIFEIATSISTPLALAGLIATVFFYVIRQILYKNIFPKLTKQLSSNIILIIINRLFILSLVAMLLGFSGYVIDKFNISGEPDEKMLIEGIVLLNNIELENVNVKVLEIEKTTVTNHFGKFRIEFFEKEAKETYTFRFSHHEITDTTPIVKGNENLSDLKFYFLPNSFKKEHLTVSRDENTIEKFRSKKNIDKPQQGIEQEKTTDHITLDSPKDSINIKVNDFNINLIRVSGNHTELEGLKVEPYYISEFPLTIGLLKLYAKANACRTQIPDNKSDLDYIEEIYYDDAVGIAKLLNSELPNTVQWINAQMGDYIKPSYIKELIKTSDSKSLTAIYYDGSKGFNTYLSNLHKISTIPDSFDRPPKGHLRIVRK